MKKHLIIAMGVALLLLALTGNVVAAKTTINLFMHSHEPLVDAMTQLSEEYMKEHPDIYIELSHVPVDQWETKLVVMAESGAGPDIVNPFNPGTVTLVAAGRLDPAPDFVIEDIMENFPEPVTKGGMVDGKIYGYKLETTVWLPIVNLDLYEESGLAEPETWDDLIEVNRKLTKVDENGEILQAGVDHGVGLRMVQTWGPYLWNRGVDVLNEDKTKAAFNTPEGIKATEEYLETVHPELSDSFIRQQCVIATFGPWYKPIIDYNAPDIRYKAFAPLKTKAGEPAAMGYDFIWGVNANSDPKVKEEAWKFLMYVGSTHGEEVLNTKCGLVIGRTEYMNSPEIQNDPWQKVFYQGAMTAIRRLQYFPGWPSIEAAIYQQMSRMASEEISIEEGLKLMEEDINRLLESM